MKQIPKAAHGAFSWNDENPKTLRHEGRQTPARSGRAPPIRTLRTRKNEKKSSLPCYLSPGKWGDFVKRWQDGELAASTWLENCTPYLTRWSPYQTRRTESWKSKSFVRKAIVTPKTPKKTARALPRENEGERWKGWHIAKWKRNRGKREKRGRKRQRRGNAYMISGRVGINSNARRE